MFGLFKSRVHESVAIAAVFAASVTMHIAWIVNLVVHRSEMAWEWFLLSEEIGPISGMYTKTFLSFFGIFLVAWLFWRGRDCSHWRLRVFWFFVMSIIIFLFMTLPIIYEFRVG